MTSPFSLDFLGGTVGDSDSRLKVFRGRLLGDLSGQDFAGLVSSPWLGKVEERWPEVGAEIHNLYHAIQARLSYEREQAESTSEASGPVVEPSHDFSERITVEQHRQRPPQLASSAEQSQPIAPPIPSWGVTADAPPEEPPPHGLRMLAPVSPTVQPSSQPPLPPIGRGLAVPNDVEQIAPEPCHEDVQQPLSPAPDVLARAGKSLPGIGYDGAKGTVEQRAADKQPEEVSLEPAQANEELPLPKMFRLQSRKDVMWELRRLGPEPAEDKVLETLELADAALGRATGFAQVRRISSVAEVLRACTRELAMSKAIQDDAARFAILAEHHANELLKKARERGELSAGTRGQLRGRTPAGEPNISKPSSPYGVPEGTPPEKSTLADAGLDKNFAKRVRRWGDISRQDLEVRIQTKRAEGRLTKTAVLTDPKPKKELQVSRYFRALLEDFAEHSADYDAKSFADDAKLLKIYQSVAEKLGHFLAAFDLEAAGS